MTSRAIAQINVGYLRENGPSERAFTFASASRFGG